MSEIKWIKIATDIFNDEKIMLIEAMPDGDSLIVIWFKLLCLAGIQNNGGSFLINDKIAYTDEMLATIFRRNINTVRMALQTFEAFGMVQIIDGLITIPNWSKHQSMIDKNEYFKLAKRKQREQEKLKELNDVQDNVKDMSMTVKGKNKEQKNKEERIEEYVHCTEAAVPTIDEVGSFAKVNGIPAEISERFFYHYNKSGWTASNGQPVQNWKGLLMSWHKASTGKSEEMDPIIAQVVQSTARS